MNTKRIISLMLLVMMVFTSIPFVATAAPSYWGYDDYETVDYPGAPEEITSYSTTLKKVSASRYTFTSTISGVGTISIALHETNWGTFNLGSWVLTTTGGTTHTFVTDSTDLEYVHEYYYQGTSECTYSGGNHGGEVLESLKFYDGVNGNEITLAVGGTYTANAIHVIEKTKLLDFPDDNNDSINDYNNKSMAYTEDQVYAKLTRKYTFTGPQIKLNVDYLYAKDSYHGKIYACMFPIDKKYGLYCDMIDENGAKIKTISTFDTETGTYPYKDYSGPSNAGNAATRAVVYGKNYPQYQFDIRVTTLKDSLDNIQNTHKTSFWDMNKGSNKLYFSRLNTNDKKLHKKGSELHTEAIWLFRYSADGSLPTYTDGSSQGESPISLNKSYDNPVSNAVQGDGSTTKYGALLTDGVASGTYSYSDDTWALLFKGRNADTNGIGTIIIDLEKTTAITKLRAHLANATITQTLPLKSLKAYGSTDGSTYNELGSFTINTSSDAVYWTEITAPANTKARYVKFEFELDGNFAAVNELEVYGASDKRVSIAKSKSYSYDGVYVDANGNEVYPDEGGKSLTDGILAPEGATYSSSEYLCFYTATDFYKAHGYGYITVDLGKSYTMDRFVADVATKYATSGVTAPKSVEILVSDDNEAWASAGVVTLTDTDATSHILATLNLTTPVSGRYVQYRFVANSVLFMVAEVEAYEFEEPVEDEGDNLLLNKTYTTTAIHGDNTYPDENGKSLTDGAYASTTDTYSNVTLVGFNANTDDYKRDGYASITVDLGKAYNLNKFKTYLASENEANIGAGVRWPSYVEVFVSSDNANWTSAGKAYPEISKSEDCSLATLKLTTAVSGRYVQFRIVSEKNWIMISEVKAFGEEHTHTAIDKWLSDSNNHWKECACGEDMNKESHTAGDWEVVTPATLENAGEQVKKCTVCKYVLETKEIPQLTPEHTHGALGSWESDKNNHWKECSCGEDLDKASHDNGAWVTVKEADVDVEGKKELRCTVCQYVLKTETIPAKHSFGEDWASDKDNHWHECACGEKSDVAPHTAGDWEVKTPATIEKAGEQVKKCTVCKYVLETKEIPQLTPDHTHSEVGGWASDKDNHWNECSCGEDLNKAPHTAGDWEVKTPATLDKAGEQVKKCTVCEYILETKEIPKLDEEKPSTEIMLGDVNDSKEIDSMDYVLVKRAYFGTFTFNDDQLKAADVNASGDIDSMDYVLIKRAYFGTFAFN